ncbi:hypothetical protein E4U42_003080 [Claviceps africana]|uniref:Aminotransferase class I/classII large domain-containing protein n=1 Tax=Claviceps africana TaxID=83212 RepID=A0A8K0NH29_9HYPO|nr:hypothetical protein E4U42_003080 [Claviceps africana]
MASPADKPIDFSLGCPSPSLFPSYHLLQGASSIVYSAEKCPDTLVYGPDAGYAPLRARIAAWLRHVYSPDEDSGAVSAERICITSGASANLANILTKFTEPGYTRAIWMVEPCYFLACPIFTDAGFEGRLRGVPEDEQGLDIDFLRSALRGMEGDNGRPHPSRPTLKTHQRYPKLYKHVIYAVPTFSNPSGKTMSLRRRRQLVLLARECDALVITDDVYDVLRWPERPGAKSSELGPIPPRIVDIDRLLDGGPRDDWGNAVSNGSFSKLIAPGVRTGWAEGTPSFALALSTVGATRSGGSPSHFTASLIDEMMASGAFQAHLADIIIPTYRSRFNAMRDAINMHLIPLGFSESTKLPYEMSCEDGTSIRQTHAVAAGGFFTYLTLPPDFPLSVTDLAARALDKYNVKVVIGMNMVVEGDQGSRERAAAGFGNGIRLCWAWHTNDDIIEGIKRLEALVREMRGGMGL